MTAWSTPPDRRPDVPPDPHPNDATRELLVATSFLPAWVVLAGLAVLAALGTAVPIELGFVLVLGSVLLVGLPHGAVDHLVVLRLVRAHRPGADRVGGDDPGSHAIRRVGAVARARPTAAVGLVYLVLGSAYLLGWFLSPAAAFVGFLLLTWLHWGLGDLYATGAVVGGDHLRSRPQRALAAAVRGAIPMLVPLVFHPAEYRLVADLVVGAFDPAAATVLAGGFDPTLRFAVAAGLLALVVCSLTIGYLRATRVRGWAIDAGEALLLVGFFAAVPPVVAIGVYFPLWHSIRHVGRVELLDPRARDGLRRGDVRPAIRGFVRDAAPLTAGTLLIFAGLFVLVPGAGAGLDGAVASYLVLLSVLTLPHAAITAWADWRQGVWATGT